MQVNFLLRRVQTAFNVKTALTPPVVTMLFVVLALSLIVSSATANAQTLQDPLPFSERVAKYKAEQNWNLVIIHAQEWTRKEPQNAFAWNELSMAFARMGQREDSIRAAKHAVQNANTVPVLWWNLAVAYQNNNEHRSAFNAYKEAARLDPKATDALTEIGAIYLRFDSHAEALKAFQESLRHRPQNPRATCGKGWALAGLARWSEVKSSLSEVKDLDHECGTRLERALANYNKGRADAYNAWEAGHFDAFGNPRSGAAKEAWRRFSENHDGRCNVADVEANCEGVRRRLLAEFHTSVRQGRIRLD